MHSCVRVLLLLTYLISSLTTHAQWNSFIINYKKEVFARGPQTWQIRAYDEDHIFCGNKNGILQYNGNNWQLYPFQNASDVRSIHISHKQNRIYAGGESEFGYLEADDSGQMVYTPLSNTFNMQYQLYGGYWGIFEVDNLMYYVSDKYVVKQINDHFTPVRSEIKIDCSAMIDGILHVGTTNGIFLLVGNTWLPAPGNASIQNQTIRAIVPYKNGYLAATALNGLYVGDESGIYPFPTGADEFMHKNEVFSLAAREDYIAIGTIHKGLMIIETATNRVEYYNDQKGLQNNTILSLCFDKQDGLWLGLDNGIDYISLNTSLTNLYTNPYSKGTGYAAIIEKKQLFLGTNRGLFVTNWPIHLGENAINLQLIPELSGQVWGLEKVGDEIFCLHDKGVYLLKGKSIERIPGLRGGLLCYAFDSEPDKCWIGTYDGLFLLQKKKGKWQIQHHLEGITNWMKDLQFETPYILWKREANTGITRVEIDKETCQKASSELYTETKGFDSVQEIQAHKTFGEIRFTSLSGIYKYDKTTNRMVKDEELCSYLQPGMLYSKLVTVDNTLYALSPEMIQVVRFDKKVPLSSMQYPFDPSQIDFIRAYEALTAINDSLAIIPNEFGFALLNTEHAVKQSRKELFIKSVHISYPKDTLIYADNILDRSVSPRIPFMQNALRFEYASRNFGQTVPVRYRCRLLPDTLWGIANLSTTKEYSNLQEGSYTFEVEALFPDGSHSNKHFDFSILPPWYRSIYAKLGYLALLLLSLYLLFLWENRRITRKRKAALAQKEKEMFLKEQEFLKEQLKQEQKIIELRNENLEQELTFKSQEMANLMINFTRKNEILLDIKQELYKITAELKGDPSVKAKRMLLTLNNSIDSNIASDDALKRFEEQFNLVHNNFMKKVREKHTDLSTSEIKMCAYVKMGLSSKEMAPLLNISIRGVETLRYRLRKKMELDREASLTEYLNTFA